MRPTNPSYIIQPLRRTTVTIDERDNEVVTSEPPFSFSRANEHLGREQEHTNVVYLPNVGYCLKPKWFDVGYFMESDFAEDSILVLKTATATKTSFVPKALFRAANNTEQSNVEVDKLATLKAYGTNFYNKVVEAGGDWAAVLTADQAALSRPSEGTGFQVDRVAVSEENDSDIGAVMFLLNVPTAMSWTPGGHIATFYFNGPTNCTKENGYTYTGKGQYAITIHANGQVYLYEFCTTTEWKLRSSFSITNGVNIQPGVTAIIISRYPYSTPRSTYGTMIFRSSTPAKDIGLNFTGNTAMGMKPTVDKDHVFLCRVDNLDARVRTTIDKLRVDIRRDLRMGFSIAKEIYPTSGIVKDSWFDVGFVPLPRTPATPFSVYVNAFCPPNTSYVLHVYAMDEDGETEIYTSTDQYGAQILQFDPAGTLAKPVRQYRFEFDLKGDGISTPYLLGFKCKRDGVGYAVTTPGKVLPNYQGQIEIVGQEFDFSHSSAKVAFADPFDDTELLRTRASMPIEIKVCYDDSDPDPANWLYCKLFKGYVQKADRLKKGRNSVQKFPQTNMPANDWSSWVLTCIGEHQRLIETLTEAMQPLYEYKLSNVSGEAPSSIPLKVTDAIKWGLSQCGYPAEMMSDIDDYPIRLFGGAMDDPAWIEPLSKFNELFLDWTRNILGYALHFDANGGTEYATGKWRGSWTLLAPAKPPYTPKARFYLDRPSFFSGKRIMGHYANYTNGGIPGTFIADKSFQSHVYPPETNHVVVSCLGMINGPLISETEYTGTVEYPNLKSYYYHTDNLTSGTLAADPTHPDFIGRRVPAFFIDNSIGYMISEEQRIAALRWVCTRLYDIAAHAIKLARFVAPLILIDHERYPGRKRPLRYYDPIEIDGETFLVRNVNIMYKKDHIQMATYEVEAPRI